LPKFGIETNGYVLFLHSPVEYDCSGARVGAFWVMTKYRAKNAEKCVLHVELLGGLKVGLGPLGFGCINHDAVDYTLATATVF
jgi:hypothetical protein